MPRGALTCVVAAVRRSPRFNVQVNKINEWIGKLMPSRQVQDCGRCAHVVGWATERFLAGAHSSGSSSSRHPTA